MDTWTRQASRRGERREAAARRDFRQTRWSDVGFLAGVVTCLVRPSGWRNPYRPST